MRNECDTEWTPSQAEIDHLSVFGSPQDAVVAIGNEDKIEAWEIGRAAWEIGDGKGFSPGTTSDEATHRKNWSSSVSKATRKNRQTLPHIVALQEQLRRFRSDGGKPQSVSWQQMIDRCDHLIIHGSAGESLRAIELKVKLTGKGDSNPPAKDIVAKLVAAVGPDATVEGLRLIGAGNLLFAPGVDLVMEDAIALEAQSGASVDFEDRLKTLEDGNEESRPATRRKRRALPRYTFLPGYQSSQNCR